MRRFERKLLERLRHNDIEENNEPLKNVRKALGKVGYVKGNPLTKTEITLNITNDSFTINGEKPKIPIYLFGLTDYYSGYPNANIQTPMNNLVYAYSVAGQLLFGIVGKDVSKSIIGGGGDYVNGDLIISYYDAVPLTKYFSNIKVHCSNVAYGTFLNSFVSDLITINTIRLIVPIAYIDQFINPLTFSYQTLFGKTFTDDIDPRMYITNTDFQQQICDIPINLPIDKAIGLSFYMDFDCPSMQMILFVEKIEPLTHK